MRNEVGYDLETPPGTYLLREMKQESSLMIPRALDSWQRPETQFQVVKNGFSRSPYPALVKPFAMPGDIVCVDMARRENTPGPFVFNFNNEQLFVVGHDRLIAKVIEVEVTKKEF